MSLANDMRRASLQENKRNKIISDFVTSNYLEVLLKYHVLVVVCHVNSLKSCCSSCLIFFRLFFFQGL